ncbi:hypothetical protein K525DRAFT_199262 [Schizophyllum commune Loenen D]|nr:hypothetical protein K525DRAFT_199262 [Schizophyllum commune Loenen D]
MPSLFTRLRRRAFTVSNPAPPPPAPPSPPLPTASSDPSPLPRKIHPDLNALAEDLQRETGQNSVSQSHRRPSRSSPPSRAAHSPADEYSPDSSRSHLSRTPSLTDDALAGLPASPGRRIMARLVNLASRSAPAIARAPSPLRTPPRTAHSSQRPSTSETTRWATFGRSPPGGKPNPQLALPEEFGGYSSGASEQSPSVSTRSYRTDLTGRSTHTLGNPAAARPTTPASASDFAPKPPAETPSAHTFGSPTPPSSDFTFSKSVPSTRRSPAPPLPPLSHPAFGSSVCSTRRQLFRTATHTSAREPARRKHRSLATSASMPAMRRRRCRESNAWSGGGQTIPEAPRVNERMHRRSLSRSRSHARTESRRSSAEYSARQASLHTAEEGAPWEALVSREMVSLSLGRLNAKAGDGRNSLQPSAVLSSAPAALASAPGTLTPVPTTAPPAPVTATQTAIVASPALVTAPPTPSALPVPSASSAAPSFVSSSCLSVEPTSPTPVYRSQEIIPWASRSDVVVGDRNKGKGPAYPAALKREGSTTGKRKAGDDDPTRVDSGYWEDPAARSLRPQRLSVPSFEEARRKRPRLSLTEPPRPSSTHDASLIQSLGAQRHSRLGQQSLHLSRPGSSRLSAQPSARASTYASGSTAARYHMRDPRKPPPLVPTPWLPSRDAPRSAWLFFVGFVLFPAWWLGGLLPAKPRPCVFGTHSDAEQLVGDVESVAATRRESKRGSILVNNAQPEHDARSWQFRCRVLGAISLVTYVPFIVCLAIFAPR